MSFVINEVRRGAYLDSVALMRLARELKALPGIEEAGLMIGTPANKAILAEAHVLGPEGEAAGTGDLIIAFRASSKAAGEAARTKARELLDQRRGDATGSAGGGTASSWQPRTLRTAVELRHGANLALISVPGAFAAGETRKALALGLNAMIFSDNVPLAEEIALKREARARGLLVMGPDCGTAIIAGVPLGFANAVPRGDIGLIGASGTGIQEVSCLIAQNGGGISHAIGTGGRDLKAEVGGITTLMAIDLLDADAATRHIVIISKPPAAEVARRVLARVGRSPKQVTICFLGATGLTVPANALTVPTLEATAGAALGRAIGRGAQVHLGPPATGGRIVRGLFSGGTLCAEAQVVGLGLGLTLASNAPVPGATDLTGAGPGAHPLIDLGDDAFTRGRPHPMIEPAVRDEALLAALADRAVGVVLIDIVLGTGGHPDPGGHVARLVAQRAKLGPHIVASVTGTEADRQGLRAQQEKLAAAGIAVAPSNAAAARLAFDAIRAGNR